MTDLSLPGGYAPAENRRGSLRLEPSLIKGLSQRSLPQSLFYIAVQWSAIVASIAVARRFDSDIVLLLCLFVIATRQHALAVLVHEGCHFNLCDSKFLNDLLTNVFAAFPLSMSVKRYRNSHFAHHRLLNQDDDPDIVENTPPTSSIKLAGLLLMDLCFLSLPKNAKRARKFGVFAIFTEKGEGWTVERRLYIAFISTAIVAATAFGVWKQVGLYWLIPEFSMLQVLTRLRGYADHGGRLDEVEELRKTRTVEANVLERFVFAPGSVNRHLEHHLYPSVPFYNLDGLHAALRAKALDGAIPPPSQGYLRLPLLKRSAFGEIFLKKNATPPSAEEPN